MTPLADAPAGHDHRGELPYPLSVAIWFAINLAALVLAVHWLASAVERASPDPWVRQTPWGCQAWWRRRMLPLLLCLIPAGHSLMRGQVNLLVLLLYAGVILADVRGRSALAGLWLAIPISIKVIPAFLLVYPLWRRDWRMLGGCVGGLLLTLAVLPGVVLGPTRTLDSYVELVNAVLRPGLTHQSADDSRAKELTNITSTDNQSFVAIMHYTLYPDPYTRPVHAALWVRLTTLAAGGLLTLLTLLAAPRRFEADGGRTAEGILGWGMMIMVMMFSSPMSHSHYYCWCVPVMMALAALHPPRGVAWWCWVVLGSLFVAGMFLPHLPPTAYLRDFGIVTYSGVILWAVGLMVLTWGRRKAAAPAVQQPAQQQPLAA
jgi:hypothetical protein